MLRIRLRSIAADHRTGHTASKVRRIVGTDLSLSVLRFDPAPDSFAERVYLDYLRRTIWCLHDRTESRQSSQRFMIMLVFVVKAAHQPAAQTADLRWRKGQILFLCHLDGYRLESPQE